MDGSVLSRILSSEGAERRGLVEESKAVLHGYLDPPVTQGTARPPSPGGSVG